MTPPAPDFLVALAGHSLAGFYLIQDDLFRYVNPAFTTLFGYSSDEVVGKLGPADLIVSEDQPRIEESRQRLLELAEESLHYEVRGRTKSGAIIDLEVLVVSAPYQGRPAVMGMFVDATLRKRAEREKSQLLESLRERTRQLERFHELAVMMAGHPADVYEAIAGQIAELLETPYAAVIRIEGALIRSLAVVSPGDDRPGLTFPIALTPLCEVRDSRESRIFHDLVTRFPDDPYLARRRIKSTFAVPVFDRKGDVVGALNAQDTRERDFGPDEQRILGLLARRAGEEMEEERRHEEGLRTAQRLAQSEKMASLGEVVAGVAHELNNPLASVLGLAELLSRRDDLGETARGSVAKIAAEADRARKVVRNLLAFARQQEPERRPVRMAALLGETLALREEALRMAGIEVVREIADDLPSTLADSHLLQQALLNLLMNAEQAMFAAHGGGRLTLRAFPSAEGALGRGPVLRLEVEDDGPGIPEESRDRVFEPFFTTKAVGAGTGLGLSLTHSIVEQQGGAIWVARGARGGACFVVELPVVGDEGRAEPTGTAPAADRAPLAGLRVLLIEDEEALRDIGSEVLEAEGCSVVSVANGIDALARLQAREFDAVVSDVQMPGLSGLEVYRRACVDRPRLRRRFLFVTGDVVRQETARFLEETGCAHLDKPYNVDQLVACVAAVVAAAEAAETMAPPG